MAFIVSPLEGPTLPPLLFPEDIIFYKSPQFSLIINPCCCLFVIRPEVGRLFCVPDWFMTIVRYDYFCLTVPLFERVPRIKRTSCYSSS